MSLLSPVLGCDVAYLTRHGDKTQAVIDTLIYAEESSSQWLLAIPAPATKQGTETLATTAAEAGGQAQEAVQHVEQELLAHRSK